MGEDTVQCKETVWVCGIWSGRSWGWKEKDFPTSVGRMFSGVMVLWLFPVLEHERLPFKPCKVWLRTLVTASGRFLNPLEPLLAEQTQKSTVYNKPSLEVNRAGQKWVKVRRLYFEARFRITCVTSCFPFRISRSYHNLLYSSYRRLLYWWGKHRFKVLSIIVF